MFKKIKLSKNKFVLVDENDYNDLNKYRWYCFSVKKLNYAIRVTSRKDGMKTIFMHRQLLNAPIELQVDHINGNGLDNRRCNLRICTRSENLRNVSVVRGISKYKGVSFDKQTNKWIVRIQLNKKVYI